MSVKIRKWDVVLVAYPFSDLSARKVRPVLVISPDSENGRQGDAVLMAITSNTSRLRPYDLLISANHPEFPGTGLVQASAIRTNKIWTLADKLVHRKIGSLGPQLQRDVLARLAAFFEIS